MLIKSKNRQQVEEAVVSHEDGTAIVTLKEEVADEVLRKIATINLNKRGGFNRCRWDVLEEYTRRYAKFINREIELLKPDIIVCLSKDVRWFFDEGILEAPSETKVIAVFHPSYIAKDEKHLEKLRDELKGAGITWVTQNKK